MKALKIILGFIVGIILFVVLVLIAILCALSGGKNFTVDKTPKDLTSVVGDSLYDAFGDRSGNTLDIKFDSTELNGILNSFIIDAFNSEYQEEDVVVGYKMAKVQKVKIAVSNGAVLLSARAKVGIVKTTFEAKGIAAYDSQSSNLTMEFTKAKLGHVSLNPTKILKKITDSEYIKDGKIVYNLDLKSKVSEGIGKILIDTCNPTLHGVDNELVLSFDISKIIDDKTYNTVEYNVGDLKNHSTSGISLSTTSIEISEVDFNGYIRDEYEKGEIVATQEILDNEYTLKTTDDLLFDMKNGKIYYGVNLQGIPSVIVMDFELVNDPNALVFKINKFYLKDIEINTELDAIINGILDEGCYKINYSVLEQNTGNVFHINSSQINSETGALVFGVTVL